MDLRMGIGEGDHASELGAAKMAFSRPTSWSMARLNCSMLPVSNDTTVVVGSTLEVVLVLVGGGVLVVVGATLDDVELLVCVDVLVLVRCDVLCVDEVVGAGGGGDGELVGCCCVVVVGFDGIVVTVGAAPPPKFHAP